MTDGGALSTGITSVAQVDPLVLVARHLALRLDHVDGRSPFRSASQPERPTTRASVENVIRQRERARAVVDEQAIGPSSDADEEVGVAVRLDVEADDDVVVKADVGVVAPPSRGHVHERAGAVVAEDVLGRTRVCRR